jgi:indoleamine 2,3-dioxygenase
MASAKTLGCQPIVSYYSTVLSNWHLLEQTTATGSFLSAAMISGVSGSLDERWFYYTSLLVERQSVHMVPLMKAIYEAIQTSSSSSHRALLAHLTSIKKYLCLMVADLRRVSEHCSPFVFYTHLRQYLNGGIGNSDIFENEEIQYGDRPVPERNFVPLKYRLYGASAGQSPLIHALDNLFGIQHEEAPSGHSIRGVNSGKKSYFQELLGYMIQEHRNFVEWMGSWPKSLKQYITETGGEEGQENNRELKEAFNANIEELENFRRIHFQIVYKYIMQPALRQGAGEGGGVSTTINEGPSPMHFKGTGGTELVTFLKHVKKDVSNAFIGK